jgi:hypothetical protein
MGYSKGTTIAEGYSICMVTRFFLIFHAVLYSRITAPPIPNFQVYKYKLIIFLPVLRICNFKCNISIIYSLIWIFQPQVFLQSEVNSNNSTQLSIALHKIDYL